MPKNTSKTTKNIKKHVTPLGGFSYVKLVAELPETPAPSRATSPVTLFAHHSTFTNRVTPVTELVKPIKRERTGCWSFFKRLFCFKNDVAPTRGGIAVNQYKFKR